MLSLLLLLANEKMEWTRALWLDNLEYCGDVVSIDVQQTKPCIAQRGNFGELWKVTNQVWNFAEFFAGEANLSKALRDMNLSGVSFDQKYPSSGMDFRTASGFSHLGFV